MSSKQFNLRLDSSILYVENQRWSIDNDNKIAYDSNAVQVQNFSVNKGNESIRIDGRIGNSPADNLKMEFNNFHLNNLDPLLKSGDVSLSGIVGGNMIFSQVNKKWQAESDLLISDLSINQDTLGNTTLVSKYYSMIEKSDLASCLQIWN